MTCTYGFNTTDFCGIMEYNTYAYGMKKCMEGTTCEPMYLTATQDTLQCIPNTEDAPYDPYGFTIENLLQLDTRVQHPDKDATVKAAGLTYTIVEEGEPCFYDNQWCNQAKMLTCHCTTT